MALQEQLLTSESRFSDTRRKNRLYWKRQLVLSHGDDSRKSNLCPLNPAASIASFKSSRITSIPRLAVDAKKSLAP